MLLSYNLKDQLSTMEITSGLSLVPNEPPDANQMLRSRLHYFKILYY